MSAFSRNDALTRHLRVVHPEHVELSKRGSAGKVEESFSDTPNEARINQYDYSELGG